MAAKSADFPAPTVERLCCYRRILQRVLSEGNLRIYSHQLASAQRVTAAQVRRDLMMIDFAGSPSKGYDAAGLLKRIGKILDPRGGEGGVLVGIGDLGRALLAYFAGRNSPIPVVGAFDVDKAKCDRVVHGCRCYHVTDLEAILAKKKVSVAIIAVPAEAAQEVANRLVRGGVHAIMNFAPVQLAVPADVFVEGVDITVSLEKTAFYARKLTKHRKA
jgi:redox-sensing transcriptional repressor